jgi:iron complex transport system substrate-binding protein
MRRRPFKVVAIAAACCAFTALPSAVAAGAAPKRVVTLTPFAAHTIATLGKRPVGVGQTVGDRLPATLKGVPVLPLSHPNGPNMEQLARLDPDLVLSSLTWRKGHETMRRLDIEVIESEPYRPATVPGATRKIARLVGRPSKGASLARKQARGIARARDAAKANPRVMLVLGVGRTPFLFLSNSWGGDLVRQAGGDLLTSGLSAPSGFARVSDELIVQRNPQVIIAVPHGRPDDLSEIVDHLKSNPAWKATDAARNDRVYVASDNRLLQAYPDVGATIASIQRKYLHNR